MDPKSTAFSAHKTANVYICNRQLKAQYTKHKQSQTKQHIVKKI